MIDSNLKWDTHVTMVRSKVARAIGAVHRLKHLLPKIIFFSILYYSLVLPHLDYCNVIWGRTTRANLQKLQTLQNRYARMIFFFDTPQTNAANCTLANQLPSVSNTITVL